MPLARGDNGVWTFEPSDSDQELIDLSHPSYMDALPRYLTSLDSVFESAKQVSEFNFLWSIFAVRGAQDAGWDPYESTLRAIDSVREAYRDTSGEAGQHIGLWLYGHILEASEPYEFLANLLDVVVGGRFNSMRFPPQRPGGPPLSPGIKIERLSESATAANLPDVVSPLVEIWDRDLRNAVFHADYSLFGPQVRTLRPMRIYEHDEIMTLINRALAYHETMSILRKIHIESYEAPVVIPADPRFTNNPGEMATVIVRHGHGATGLKDAWTQDEVVPENRTVV